MTQRAANNYDALKCLALIAMTIDHVGFFLLPQEEWLRVIGRVAAPIFLFLVGYNGSYRFRYSLLIAALLCSVMDGFMVGLWFPQNVLWTILIVRMILQYFISRVALHELAIIALMLIPLSMPFLDFGSLGLLCALAGYAVRQQRGLLAVLLLVAALALQAGWSVATMPALSHLQLSVIGLLLGMTGYILWSINYTKPLRVAARPVAYVARYAVYYYLGHKFVLEALALMLL